MKTKIEEKQEELILIYEKSLKKTGLKYPDDYDTRLGKKVIKLKSELQVLQSQQETMEEKDKLLLEIKGLIADSQKEKELTDDEIEAQSEKLVYNNIYGKQGWVYGAKWYRDHNK